MLLVLLAARAADPGTEPGGAPAPSPPAPAGNAGAQAPPTGAALLPAAAATPGEAAGHQRMVAALREVAERTRLEHRYLSDEKLQRYRREIAALAPDAPLRERANAHLLVGKEEFELGSLAAAIEHLASVDRLLGPPADAAGRAFKSQLHYFLGVAHLRLGERQNCVARHTAASCLFPIGEEGVHRLQEGSRQAIAYLRRVLAEVPPESAEAVAARWLLNIAHMTVGDYPQRVPPAELLPPEALASEAEFPRFTDVAPRLGLDTFDLAGGAIADDFDGDGLLDLLTSTYRPSGAMHLFVNRGDGSFAERTAEANLDGITGGLNMLQADYDGDGDLDVLVLRGAWLEAAGRHPNSLLRNRGDGTFTDVTFAVGLGEVHYPTQTAAWADYDGDGDLDLYVGNEATPEDPFPSQLFRNQGDGTFVDVAPQAGVENLRYAKGVAWGDFDGDRRPDLYVSNWGQENRLYHNRGDGTFVDVAPRLGLTLPLRSFPVWFWDFDNDGALDLYVASYPNPPGPRRLHLVVARYFGLPAQGESARLYRGDGRGGFSEVAVEQNLTAISMPMGANFGDLDNDGYLDFYLGTGYPSYDGLTPNLLYWNRRGRGFADVTAAAGMGHLQKGHGVAFADLDNDGDLDVFEQMGGFFPEDGYADVLYENPGFGRRWLKVRLRGVRSNAGGVGARIRVEFVDGGERRSVYRQVGSGGSFGANPLLQHIGLGGAGRVELLEVFWPTTGELQSFRDLATDQAIEIVEGRGELTPLPHPSFRFRR